MAWIIVAACSIAMAVLAGKDFKKGKIRKRLMNIYIIGGSLAFVLSLILLFW